MSQRRSDHRGGDERGAAALELALVLPILVLLVFGIIQFAITYNRAQGLHAAAREGARVASLPHITQSDIEDRVIAALEGVLADPGDVDITVSPGAGRPCNLRTGENVVVQVEYPHQIEIPLWGTEDLTLRGRGEFRCE
jgi:hypothetical protein